MNKAQYRWLMAHPEEKLLFKRLLASEQMHLGLRQTEIDEKCQRVIDECQQLSRLKAVQEVAS